MEVQLKRKDKKQKVDTLYITINNTEFRITEINGKIVITKIVDTIYIYPIVGNQIAVF